MHTVPITIEDATFAELDAAARADGLTLAEFVRRAAETAMEGYKAREQVASASADGSASTQRRAGE